MSRTTIGKASNIDAISFFFFVLFSSVDRQFLFCHQSIYMNNVMMYKRTQKKCLISFFHWLELFMIQNHHFLRNYHYHMYSNHYDCEFEVMDFVARHDQLLLLLQHDALQHVVMNSFQLLF